MKKINQTQLNIFIQNHNLYLNTISDQNKKGERLILDEIDFTDNDLSNLDFVETYITSSLFNGNVFKNTNFGGAELYDCFFKDIEFENCNFGKTTFNYTKFLSSKFINCNLIDLETLETQFEELLFENCFINSAFSNCIVKDVDFKDCTFASTEFWQCIIESLKFFMKKKDLDIIKLIKEINTGTIERPTFIKDQEAVEYFKSRCIMYNI